MNTIEGNKLIAEFMGFQIKPYEMNEPPFTKYDEFVWDGVGAIFKPSNLVYHSSWDWLMPVVEKIAELDGGKFSVDISSVGMWACFIKRDDVFEREIADFGGYNPMILNVFNAVVKFIEWYNKQQSVKESDTSKAT